MGCLTCLDQALHILSNSILFIITLDNGKFQFGYVSFLKFWAGFVLMKLKLSTVQQSYIELIEVRIYIFVLNFIITFCKLELCYTFKGLKIRENYD